MFVPEVRWPLLVKYLADPLAPGFPVAEYLTDPHAKYARSTDYRFHRRSIDFREAVFSNTNLNSPQAQ